MSSLLEITGISKQFPGVRALDNVSLTLNAGEILAVVGENGAGKSTLMKILAGIEQPDSGTLKVDGITLTIQSVRQAQALGIALIHQELNLAGNLSVAANIFLGREPRRGWFIRKGETVTESNRVLRQVGLDVPPGVPVETLSLARQQLVEIAKALSANARILIMDEPTSSLSQYEAAALFRVVRELRAGGVSIIYISHRLAEVEQLADRVVVLRDGRKAGELGREEISHDALIRLMVGRDFAVGRRHCPSVDRRATPVMEARNLRTTAHPRCEVSFSLYAGEIVGIAGLVGAGRTELLETIFGVRRPAGGTLALYAEPLTLSSPREAIRAGIALVPEDRKLQGVILDMAVRENLSLPSLRRDARGSFINRNAEKTIAAEAIERLQIRTPTDRQIAQYLSGGNQQKIVLGKWLSLRPRLLLLDEPTRGIDIGAKQEIYSLVEQLAANGVAILFVSSEMEEILRLSTRAIVMYQGQITGELSRDELSEQAVMRLATGKVAE